ncbi:Fe-S cluster assembly protein SufD [Legionella spiritensis]|uniref:Fe-S cluster assembly protein SufD n=1 Tax=Legionella spiritensis TaxID=452 RepID=UPI000F7090EE|nr:Fe-S cluster assembly protein SufD [Legionella spiritensis]VEG90724.1 component of SufBCD complex [Legionella spiritensis]
MSEVLDFYQQQARESLSGIPWLAELQKKALGDFEHYAFPGKKQEDWKYTAMDTFLKERFSRPVSNERPESDVPCDLPYPQSLTLVNGRVSDSQKEMAGLPDGVLVMSLARVFQEKPEWIQSYLGGVLRHEHGFHALNSAILTAGVVIYIPKGVRVADPIVLHHWQDQASQAVHLRHVIIAEEGSEATVIEHYQGADGCAYFTNTVSEIWVAAEARLVHYKIQRESKAAFHIGHLAVRQKHAGQFESHSFSLGGRLVRSDISIALEEEGARSLMNGLYMPEDGQHIDHHTTVRHLVPGCRSEQDYKGILTGRSRAVFNGKVIVARDAQHTEAHQQNKNLLLSDKAEVDTKPQLEIFADDVICSHGATVGQLDEDALFYLASRGIERPQATGFLIHAFAADNLRLIPDRVLSEWMAAQIGQQLR